MKIFIFQDTDFFRLFLINTVGLGISVFFLVLAATILRRNRSRLNLILCGFYISEAMGFIINAIFIHIQQDPLIYILYFSSLYLLLFGQIFLVIFNLFLLKMELKNEILAYVIILYGILIFVILMFPGGFNVNEETNWRPLWSWTFLFIVYIVMTCAIFIPFTYFTFRLYRNFEDKELKRKLQLWYIGFLGVAIALYGGFLWVTWDNLVFRTIWGACVPFIAIISGWLIYKAWGKRP